MSEPMVCCTAPETAEPACVGGRAMPRRQRRNSSQAICADLKSCNGFRSRTDFLRLSKYQPGRDRTQVDGYRLPSNMKKHSLDLCTPRTPTQETPCGPCLCSLAVLAASSSLGFFSVGSRSAAAPRPLSPPPRSHGHLIPAGRPPAHRSRAARR